MSQKTWGGRFTGQTDSRVEAFTESVSLDRRLYRHDIRASQAHARMLAEVGLLTADEADKIGAALDAIAADIEAGRFTFSVGLEDIHTPIERALVARPLGFESVAANSLDVSSDRDFLLEFVFVLSLIALHLSGWAEEWVLWATTEFNFLELPDAFCTGSSIMPHKKNPDVLELIRGKSARVTASVQRLMMLVKGLPLAYNRDLQEDKEALFDAFDTVSASLELAAALVRDTTFRRESIAARIEDGYLDATTLMECFVKHGVPLRSAHEAVGKLVRQCEERNCKLADL